MLVAVHHGAAADDIDAVEDLAGTDVRVVGVAEAAGARRLLLPAHLEEEALAELAVRPGQHLAHDGDRDAPVLRRDHVLHAEPRQEDEVVVA